MEQVGNEESSSIERQETGSTSRGPQKTAWPMGPMTVEHERWDEFIDSLLGAGGCDFHLVNPNDGTSATWTCDGTDVFAISRRILAKMGLTANEVEQSISYFMRNGGFCDCEVWLNVDHLAGD